MAGGRSRYQISAGPNFAGGYDWRMRMPKQFSTKLFTIGHATRPVTAFIELLNEAEVRLVVDVRTAPRSRTNPQFDRDTLADSLATFGIEYRHIASLGGLRPRQKEIAASTNAFWQNQSFHNYADYAMSREFQSALDELRGWAMPRHAPSCAPRCYGGAATGGSSPTICSRQARRYSTFSAPATSKRRRSRPLPSERLTAS